MDRWEYLITEEYSVRHHIAEYYLRDLPFVIDIGAYKKSIKTKGRVAIIDPLCTISKSYHGTIKAWKDANPIPDDQEFGIMFLGLEINGGMDEFYAVKDLFIRSKRAVIEYSVLHGPSCADFVNLTDLVQKEIKLDMDYKVGAVDTNGYPPHNQRRLVVFEQSKVAD